MVGIRSVTYQMPEQYTQRHLEQIANLSRVWEEVT